MNFVATDIKATIVALNYNCIANEFLEKLEDKDIIDKYKLKLQDIKWGGQNLPPKQILNELRTFVPYIYITEDTTIRIIYNQNEFKLSIEKKNFCEDTFEQFQHLSSDILDLKLSDITAVGINYNALFNLGKAKLNLLNNEIIDKIPDFKNNLTFEFVLPIEYPDRNLVATYRIKKKSGGDETNEPRIYDINVNFHFDFTKLSTGEKAEKVKDVLSYNLYEEFITNSQKFLELNNGR